MISDQEVVKIVKNIKIKIKKMLQERPVGRSKEEENVFVPSKYWSKYCDKFQYLYDIDERYFSNLRFHTYHLTSDIYLRYMPPEEKEGLVKKFKSLWYDLPAEYQLSEPEEGYGFSHYGRWLNTDLLRFQKFIKALYVNNTLQKVRNNKQECSRILEIGGGYGGMAYAMASSLDNETNYQYFIIDLPEVLLFSASYLSMHIGEDKVYLYDSSDAGAIIDQDFNGYSFVLLPNYKIDLLKKYNFSLVINISSFQEMKKNQVIEYLDFVFHQCKGVMFSYNRDENFASNPEGCDLYQLLNERFDMVEIDEKKIWTTSLSLRELLAGFIKRIIEKLIFYSRGSFKMTSDYKMRLCKSKNFY